MPHPSRSSHRYQLHSPPPSPSRSTSDSMSMSRASTPDLLEDWAVVSGEEDGQGGGPGRTRTVQEAQEGDKLGECGVAVPELYAAGVSELVSILVAHDRARSAAGQVSNTSALDALASITTTLKQALASSVSSSGASQTGSDVATVARDDSLDRVDGDSNASGHDNSAIVSGQAQILAKLDSIEQMQLAQVAARDQDRSSVAAHSVKIASLTAGLKQLRLALRHSLAPFVADFDDFATAPSVPPAPLSVAEAYTFVADYCATHSLAAPHYSYAARAAVPSCHRFNGSLTGGVCTVQLGTPTDKHLGGVVTVRGTGDDAGAARGRAYVALARALQSGARGGQEVVLANGDRLGLAEAAAFAAWYCARFHFAPPALEHSQSSRLDAVPGVWHVALSVAGRRIGQGEALDREEAAGRARLDMAGYLHGQDEALWEAWEEEKRADEAVRSEVGEKVDEVVGAWEREWLE